MTRLGKLNWLWSALALLLVVLGIILTRGVVDYGSFDLAGLVDGGGNAWLALPLTVLAFTALAFVGMPQWVLIGAAVVVFGPVLGAGVSWVATLVSALANFALGKAMGGEKLRARMGPKVGRWVDRLGERGILAALLVRLVPTGPFVLINMAAGASPMRARDFAIGTAIGIVPKIVAIALFGRGLVELLAGDNFLLAVALLILAVGIGIALWLWRRKRAARGMGEIIPENTPRPS